MQKTWVLVADKSRARLFTLSAPVGALEEFEDRVYPQARLHGNERLTDGSSRTHRHEHEHHTFPPPDPPQEHEAVEFASALATRLDSARQQGDFERLIVVAPPDFLGALRRAMTEPTRRLLALAIDKNLTQLPSAEIRRLLPGIL
jgi:protein required for attachment to host cells